MFDIGFTEMLLIALIALVVLGPERLPKVARKLGGLVRQSRQMFYKFQHELSKETEGLDQGIKSGINKLQHDVKDVEKDVKAFFTSKPDHLEDNEE
ncbi:MAG: twin-arginine translocase subunit TatB [Gammaproteobacteria bacterium]|nr:Sec-independent protein translocase protein TatB [Gammaproteobacteria bacterium]NNC96715.1 twin-arginine translocase subunit TatB [Gammaproteobacteria bacterium]